MPVTEETFTEGNRAIFSRGREMIPMMVYENLNSESPVLSIKNNINNIAVEIATDSRKTTHELPLDDFDVNSLVETEISSELSPVGGTRFRRAESPTYKFRFVSSLSEMSLIDRVTNSE